MEEGLQLSRVVEVGVPTVGVNDVVVSVRGEKGRKGRLEP